VKVKKTIRTGVVILAMSALPVLAPVIPEADPVYAEEVDSGEAEVLNGWVEENGAKYYYIDGVMVKKAS